ncbi:MAG: hypothetical protein LIP08_12670 [Bacteroides sp.]|nr:hypothetical protein [Bacteroides sp.]
MPHTPDQQAEWRKTEKVYTPRIKRITEKALKVHSVTLAYDYTEVEFEYEEKHKRQDVYLHPDFTPFAYRIRLDGKEYHQLYVSGDLTERRSVKPGDRLHYRIRFQPPPAHPGTFDIIEGIHGGWDVFGVTLIPRTDE